MPSSDKVDLLSAALVKFQGQMPPVPKTSLNPFFGSSYADLADIREAARPHLLECELAVTQWPGKEGLTTIIHHSSGQWMSETMNVLMDKETSQAQGSALTYARRYAYTAALGIVTEPDDDGNAAGHEGRKVEQPKPVDPEADKRMGDLANIIRKVKPDSEREKLASHLRGLYGPSIQMNPTQLENAIFIALNWPPTVPVEQMGQELVSEGESF